MAEVTISNSPVHNDIIITYPYGVVDSGYSCGWHTGCDFAPYGITENNPLLYPVFEGKVVYINNDTSEKLGVQAQILDNNGYYWRYCHMVTGSLQVKVGDIVNLNSVIGRMGATRKCNRKTLTLRMLNNSKLAMFYICKSLRFIKNT